MAYISLTYYLPVKPINRPTNNLIFLEYLTESLPNNFIKVSENLNILYNGIDRRILSKFYTNKKLFPTDITEAILYISDTIIIKIILSIIIISIIKIILYIVSTNIIEIILDIVSTKLDFDRFT